MLKDLSRLLPLLTPYPLESMQTLPLSTRVNRVGVEGPELIQPLELEEEGRAGELF